LGCRYVLRCRYLLYDCRYVLSKDKKALMLSYILALAVRVENSSVLEPHCLLALAEELKAKPGDLVNRFR